MAYQIADRVQDTTTSSGTGSLTLSGTAPSGYQAFGAVCSNNDTFPYLIVDSTANTWEVGIGTYSTTGPSFTRSVIASSNSNALVNFAGNTANVYLNNAAGSIKARDSVVVPLLIVTGVAVGMNVTGTNIPANTKVLAVSGTTVTLNNCISAGAGILNGAAIAFAYDMTIVGTITATQPVAITPFTITDNNG